MVTAAYDLILVEVDAKCQFVVDKLNLTQSFYPGEVPGEEGRAGGRGKGKESIVSEHT